MWSRRLLRSGTGCDSSYRYRPMCPPWHHIWSSQIQLYLADTQLLTHGWANKARDMHPMASGLIGEFARLDAEGTRKRVRDVLVVTLVSAHGMAVAYELAQIALLYSISPPALPLTRSVPADPRTNGTTAPAAG